MLNDIYDLTDYDGIGKKTVIKIIDAGLGGYRQLKNNPGMLYILDFDIQGLLEYLGDNGVTHRSTDILRAVKKIKEEGDIKEIKEVLSFELPIDKFKDSNFLLQFKRKWNESLSHTIEFNSTPENIYKYGKTIGLLNKLERGFSVEDKEVQFIIDTIGFKDLELLENKGDADMEKDIDDFENTEVDWEDKTIFELSKEFDIDENDRGFILKFKRKFNKLVPLEIDVENSMLDIDQINRFKKISSNVAMGKAISEFDLRYILCILDTIYREEGIEDTTIQADRNRMVLSREDDDRRFRRDRSFLNSRESFERPSFIGRIDRDDRRNRRRDNTRRRDSIFRGVDAEIEAILEDHVTDETLLKFIEKLEDMTYEKEMDFPVNKSIMFEILKKRLSKNIRGRR
jgi:hypothetical protein